MVLPMFIGITNRSRPKTLVVQNVELTMLIPRGHCALEDRTKRKKLVSTVGVIFLKLFQLVFGKIGRRIINDIANYGPRSLLCHLAKGTTV